MTQSPTRSLIASQYKISSQTTTEVNKNISNNKTSSIPSLSSSNHHSNDNDHDNNHNTISNKSSQTKECPKPLEVIHDENRCMFKLTLDSNGNTAALLYLPTSCQNTIEFYHIEIPSDYRHQGLGDLLLSKAIGWAEECKKWVIPTCPFVRKYLSTRLLENYSCIVNQEKLL